MKHTVTEVKLKNGARGLLIDVPGATVMSFQFQFRAGNRYVRDKENYETAHVMEHMAFGANAKFKSEHEYEAEFTKNGAYHNAYTSDLSMVYVADCADFEWDRILSLQRVAICQPKFNAEELEAEGGVGAVASAQPAAPHGGRGLTQHLHECSLPQRKAPAGHNDKTRVEWSEWPDLNRRPFVPQTNALPGCATPRHQGAI